MRQCRAVAAGRPPSECAVGGRPGLDTRLGARGRGGPGGLPPGPPRGVPVSGHRCQAIDARPSTPGAALVFELKQPARRASRLTWWRSAESRSVRFLVTAPRVRACARDTASRLRVRTVACGSALSLVPPLRSTGSSAACATSFARFAAAMGKSDFSRPFVVGHGLRPCRRGPRSVPHGRPGDLPVPGQTASAHARSSDDAGPGWASRSRRAPRCLLQDGGHRTPNLVFAAQWLACAPPCQRFAAALAGHRA
jgi:hypothetical protein